jgi:hypothetical protein
MGVKPKMRVRKLRGSANGQGALAAERRKTDERKTRVGVPDSIPYHHGTHFEQIDFQRTEYSELL